MEDFDFYFLNNDKRVTLHPVFLVELRTPDFRKKRRAPHPNQIHGCRIGFLLLLELRKLRFR